MVNNKIKNIREVMFMLTQVQFAQLLNCCPATLSRWENGHFNPNMENIIQIVSLAKTKGYILEYKDVVRSKDEIVQ